MVLNNNLAGATRNVLTTIHEGMSVYGANGDHIGKVDFVYMGASTPVENETGTGAATSDAPPLRDDNTIVDAVVRTFEEDDLPDVLRARLQHDGFVHINADGIFSSDRYVLAEQIASVVNDRVTLKVNKSDLIKR